MSFKLNFHVTFVRRFVRQAARVSGTLMLLFGMLFGPAQTAHAGPPVTMTVNTTADTVDVTPGNGVCNDSSGNCSLRAAVMEANEDPGSIIQFDTALNGMPIILSITGNDYTANAGDLDINASTNIVGNGPSNTIIQAATNASYASSIGDKVFGINQSGLYPSLTVNFSGLTIRYGDNNIPTSDPDFAYTGGGVDVYFTGSGNSTTFTNCVISNNRSRTSYGGGLNVDSNATGANTLTLTNVTFSNNSTMSATSTSHGGALNVFGNNVTINIQDSTFANNTVPTGNRYGGAINFDPNSGSLTISGTTFSGNSAQSGGAVHINDNTATIQHSQFTGNTATDTGGAVAISSGTATIRYNRIVGNSATATPASDGIAVYSGTVNAIENWWGCNTGPGGTCDGTWLSAGTITTSPYLNLGIAASPVTVSAGQSTTLMANFLQDSATNPVAPADLSAMVGVPVTWSAIGGTLSGQQLTIQTGGTATATLTPTGGCGSTATGSATADSATVTTGAVTVQCADLTAVKSNNVGGTTVFPTGWDWTIHVANSNIAGTGYADFSDGETLLTDNLPTSGLTYGTPAVSGASGLTGMVNCAIDGSSNLNCTASGAVQLAAGGSFNVVFSATPSATGLYTNPRAAGSCSVDPGAAVIETDKVNNFCSNSVTVNMPPVITSAANTTFTETLAGSFTVTTSGFPTGASMFISEVGPLPSGVTFTNNGDGTATLAGTPALGTLGNYPITITADNGILPSATQSFTLVVEPNLRITSADNTTFTVGSAGSFTVTTIGTPTPTLSRGGPLPGGVTFIDHGDGTGTLSGTPAAGTAGTYPITFTASNGVAPNYVQNFTLTVNQVPAITSGNNTTFTIGGAGTFTVTTTGFPLPGIVEAGGLPGGVTFTDNGDGTATLAGTPAAGTVGTYLLTITASNGVAPDATQNFTLTVNQAATATAITSDAPDPSVVGQAVTFNYTVSVVPPGGGTPVGNVTVSNGPDSCTATVAAGSCTITLTVPGTSNFTAAYIGNANYAGSTSAIETHTVNQAATTTAITSDVPDPSVVGQVVTFNYTVSVVAPGMGTPAGDVTVSNGTDSCTATVAAGSCTITLTDPGTSNFTAAYIGNANYAGSTSAIEVHTVNQASTTTSITSDLPDPSLVGQSVTVNFGVTVTAPGAGTPTGNVTVSDGVNNCVGTVAAGSCNITLTTTGARTLTATYAGNANFNGSTSVGVSHNVNQAPAITSVDNTSFEVGVAGSFTVTTTGYPAPGIIQGGAALPGGVNFTDNGDGTGTLSGTPAAGTGGTYNLTFTASNGVAPIDTQNFTLTVGQAPTITSPNNVTFTIGSAGSFTVTTTGFSIPIIIRGGAALPGGISFTDNGNGTGTLSGTPTAGTGDTYNLTFTASNGILPNATQNFTLTINEAPAITSANNTGFTVGAAGSFTVTTTGFPTGASMSISEAGALPGGVTFTNNGNGTATLAGTPGAGTGGTYAITITAANGVLPNATQNFTLTVGEAPAINSPNNVAFVAGNLSSFTITTTGAPPPTLTYTFRPPTVTLPSGIGFVDNSDGTATLSGIPALSSVGTYNLTFTASNGVAPNAPQNFTLTIIGPPGVSRINSSADTGDGQVLENEHTSVAITQLLVVFNKAMNTADAEDELNYRLAFQGSPDIPIDLATYDNGTFTATLDVNGSAALPNGRYTLTVEGDIRDTLGAPIGTNFMRVFFMDNGAPTLTSVITVQNGAAITDGTTINVQFSSIDAAFNEDVYDPAGSTDPDDVTNPANYLLIAPGPNGAFDTLSCAAGLAADDVQIPTGPVTYSNGGGGGPFVAMVQLNNGTTLPNGLYRLYVCGTTSIVDLAGNALNGGADDQRTFTVLITAAGGGSSARRNPQTGFAPGVVTLLPEQPAAKAYADLGDLWIEIPRLGLKTSITGVRLTADGWDVTWLNRQVGWLEGTAYPTWEGNTVLTAHGYTADGEAGPFALLKDLSYGETIVIHLGGMKYTYAIRTNLLISPSNTYWLTKHEKLDWVTLITCQQYDEKTQSYRYRRVVRAVLIKVEEE